MTFCGKCGSENPEGNRFCWNCGSGLIHAEEPREVVRECPEAHAVCEYPEPEEPSIVQQERPTIDDPIQKPVQSQGLRTFETGPTCADTEAPKQNSIDLGPARNSFDVGPSRQPESIDIGSPRQPSSVDLGTTSQSHSVDAAPAPVRRRTVPRRSKPASEGIPPGDPFNFRMLSMVLGLLIAVMAFYCIFGYTVEGVVDKKDVALMSVGGLFMNGVDGYAPCDVIAIASGIAMIVCIVSIFRPIPFVGGLLGLLSAVMYYSIDMGDAFELTGDISMSTGSMGVLCGLWLAVVVLSIVQHMCAKAYADRMPDKEYPILDIWFGKL